MNEDGYSATETVNFDNGDRLIVQHRGCEYYVLTFRLETRNLERDTADLVYWYGAARSFLTSLLGRLNHNNLPIDIKSGIMYLGYRMNGKLYLGEEIDFGLVGEIRSFVTVDRIEKILNDKYAIEVSFSV